MSTTTTTLTNGDSASPSSNSKFLSHITSYPVVSDSLSTLKQHPYGQKSLALANDTYEKFGKPVTPYLETPYSYAKPYVTKADEWADSGLLGTVDAHFPIVKEDTNTVVETAKGYVFWPVKVLDDGKGYVLKTWSDEYDKTAKSSNRGPGLSTSVLAIISTELKIASDFFQVVADFLGPKYQESKKKGADYVKEGQDKLSDYQTLGQQKMDEMKKLGEEKMGKGQEKAAKAKEETVGGK